MKFSSSFAAVFLALQVSGRYLEKQVVFDSAKQTQCPTYDIVACKHKQGLVDRCCLPDQGHMVLSLQWLPGYCKNAGGNKPCKKNTLKKVERDTWTLHGLWPGNCDGRSYNTNCNPDREEYEIENVIRDKDPELLSEMEKIWLSGNPDPNKDNNWFWAHEWNKHGQCVSTITPKCLGSKYQENDDIVTYFEKAVELRSIYDLYPVLERSKIVPSDTKGYNLDAVQNAFKKAFNGTQVEINCVYHKKERKQYMSEVRLCFHAKNSFDLEGPVSCPNAFSRCNQRYPVFYAVNPSKPRLNKFKAEPKQKQEEEQDLDDIVFEPDNLFQKALYTAGVEDEE